MTCAARNDALTATSGNRWKVRLARPLRELRSYAALVLIVPGGSLIALSLWMFRHRTWLAARARRGLAALLAFAVGLTFPR
jgi:hypothetical protein